MTLLFHMCLWSWWKSRRWTWQAQNHNKNEVLRVAKNPKPVLNELWFLTIDPFIRICVFNRLPYAFVPIILLQHSHCTLVTILLRPLDGLFINLAMRTRALFTKSATTLGLAEQAFCKMPFFTEWIGASSFEVILAWQSRHSSTDFFLWDFRFSTLSCHPVAWKNSEKDSAVSIFHAHWCRDGNCTCLL